MSYAVIRTGGKQYRVEAGQRLKVEKLVAEIGDEISLSDVLMVNSDSKVVLGKSDLAKVAVKAKVIASSPIWTTDVSVTRPPCSWRRATAR